MQEELHQIDVGAGRAIGMPDPITNPQTRGRYRVRSLMEEAITSSQLEGSVTTRDTPTAKDAKEREGLLRLQSITRMLLYAYDF